MSKAVSIESLSVSYHGKMAVSEASLSLVPGEIHGIVGETGSGKSTILAAVSGTLGADAVSAGAVRYGGENILQIPLARRRGRGIVQIFQNPADAFDPILRIGVQFQEFIAVNRKEEASRWQELSLDALRRVGLDEEQVLFRYPFELSGGMLQRVALALAFLGRPKLLLADEPTSALDIVNRGRVVAELKRLRETQGTSILLVTHSMEVVRNLADSVSVMQHGRIVEQGPRSEVLSSPQQDYTRALLAAVPSFEEVPLVGS